MTAALEARARWHLEIGYHIEADEPPPCLYSFDGDEDPTEGLCPDCGQGPYVCECHVGEECGRWRNGRLSSHCTKAGSEECDFECPYRNTLSF